MLILFFLIWIVLNCYFGFDLIFLEIVLFGIIISIILFFFMTKLTKWSFQYERFFLKNLHLIILYCLVLFWNVVTSNFKVAGTVLKASDNAEPVLVKFDVPIRDEILRTILANSITLTPGTITISVTDSHYLVHCLKKEFFDGFETCTLVKILLEMEARK